MGRNNGNFRYTEVQEEQRVPDTGFITEATTEWVDGCECQIDKSTQAKQIIGTDGQIYTYSYDVFIPKHFRGNLAVGARFEVTSEEGVTDEFTIQGIDDMNRKYIEVWG